MNVQFWQVSGYEANADIEDQPLEGTRLHRGTNTHDGAVVWVFHDELMGRWQEVDPTMVPQSRGSDPD